MSYTPKTVLLVIWPHSQRIMEHPEAMAIDCDGDGDGALVPAEVWEQYKNSYYVTEEEGDVAWQTVDAREAVATAFAAAEAKEEATTTSSGRKKPEERPPAESEPREAAAAAAAEEEDDDDVCATCDGDIDGDHCYCDRCNQPVCDDCQGSIDPNPNHFRYCAECC